MKRIVIVAGARPNFVKIAPLMEQFAAARQAGSPLETLLVHTGQHYDAKMSHLFFEQMGIPRPDVNLEVGSGSHGQQTGDVMMRFEPVVRELLTQHYDPGYAGSTRRNFQKFGESKTIAPKDRSTGAMAELALKIVQEAA